MPAATFLLGDLLVAAESTVAAVEAPGIGESPVGRKSTGMMGALADETGAFVSGSETPRYGIGAPPGTAGASPPEAEAKAAGTSSTSSTLANHRSSVSADTLEISASEGEVVVTGAWPTASDAPVTPPPYGGTKANGWALALAIPSVLNASAPPETSDGLKTSLAGMGPLGVSTVPASGATPDCSGGGPQPMAGDTEGAVGSGIAAVSTPPQVAVGLSDDTVSPLATATSSAPGTGAAVSGKGPSGATWPTGMTGRPSPATKKSPPVGAPHAVQKLSSGPSCVPHLRQNLYSDMLEHSLLSALRPQLHSTIA